MRSTTHPAPAPHATRRTLQLFSVACGIAAALAAASGAGAQCTPAWDTTIGTPGAGTGYVGAILPWDDGVGTPGEDLYVGGSFEIIGGQNRRALARWDRATNTWATLGSGLVQENTTFVAALAVFNTGAGDELIVGGAFGSSAGVPGTKSLAKWDGTSWSATGSLLVNNTADSVWTLKEWNGKLYVGGLFANIGGVIGANCVASWDGATWAPLGSGVANPGTTVFELETFNDGTGEALYAGGRFSGMGGVPGTALIARWNGTAWSAVGGGLSPLSPITAIETMAVYDAGAGPTLYVAGNPFIPSGQPTASVANWNGSGWTAIGQNLGGRTTCLAVFDDGSGAGEQLYNGGTAQPAINYIARLVSGLWVTVDGGMTGNSLPSFPGGAPGNFPSVFSMGVWDDALYVGGNFATVGGQASNGLVTRTSCGSCYPDCNNSGSLTLADFGCFQGKYVLGDLYADCNNSGTLSLADFGCFQSAYVLGCP